MAKRRNPTGEEIMGILTNANLSAFIIRFWCDGERGEWRGHVTHIQTQQGCYFISLQQLEEFITKLSPIREQPQAVLLADLAG